MKVSGKLAVAGSVAALAALPATALAHPGHGHGHGHAGGRSVSSHAQSGASGSSASTHATAEKQCRSERTTMGTAAFDALYGTNKNDRNAFGKCVSTQERQDKSDQASAHSTAEKNCRSERSSDPSAFQMKYGTNKNGRNAFGKCVSSQEKAMASSMESQQVKAQDNAAKSCRSQEKSDPSTFASTYGKGRDAFGKCVSTQAKAQEQQGSSSGS
jgi:hypothetical protein